MNTTASSNNITSKAQPGVVENPHGGYHIHVQLNEHNADTIHNTLLNLRPAMPPNTPTLVEMSVFEDCVLFTLQDDNAIAVHVGDP
jgi:hypothetical protein